ncbi:phosphopantetheine-binding protein [uncultured Winogradskyella sp.]|uniref:phosphopantetheine-binding protein n=1 Tax=Winogradskyella sp. 4-2091 TaxID=3381659 RepID=UPI00262B8B2B|nr:phosphopantetheine-binding protein [uncultured Winogradskyella sp.]
MDNTIINYIKNQLIVSDEAIDLDAEDDLLGSGLLDSLSMMKLVGFIEQEFKLKIPAQDMVIENFMTVACITNYLKSKSD